MAALPIDDTRIREIKELAPPAHLLREFPVSPSCGADDLRRPGRRSTGSCTAPTTGCWSSSGPCSIHDYDAAIDYARGSQPCASELAADLVVVMRVYFEKPRTTVGWKGLINDPHLDGSFRINEGLRLARRCCSRSTSWGCPPAPNSST